MQITATLSTFRENVGDDLIRLGCEHLLECLSPGPWRYRRWAKSNALSASVELGRLSKTSIHRRSPLARAVLRRAERASLTACNPWRFRRLLASDLILLCGTPLFYFTQHDDFAGNETWPGILLHVARTGQAPPIVTLGCGAIVPDGVDELRTSHSRAFGLVRDVVSIQSLVGCRDLLTQRLIRSAGAPEETPLPVLPCPSVWAADRLGIERDREAAAGRTVCVAFSTESCNWATSGDRDEQVRIDLLGNVLDGIARCGFGAVVLAHNELDVEAIQRAKRSRRDWSGLIVRRMDATGLLEQLRHARGLVTWRVHGAVAARSLGVPALLFRTDSRSTMAEMLGTTVVDNAPSSAQAVEAFLSACVDQPSRADAEAIEALKADAFGELQALWASHVVPALERGRADREHRDCHERAVRVHG